MKSKQVIKKKLIEVALPLEAINRESAKEKSIRHGHPSTLHLWWARRPLAACRAVIFGSLVDDPSSHPDKFPTTEAQEKERKRLFAIIERLVKWENSNNEHVLKEARDEILKSTDGNPPAIYDPFCGGGSIPLEAQRLGLKAYGSDLNPVAVLITKALIEIPPKFAGMSPINPDEKGKPIKTGWRGVQGLAADVRYYGQWMREEAEKRIGKFYPKIKLPNDMGGGEATVIAWIWARTVASPNPAMNGVHVPLVRSFALSTKVGKEAWVEPVISECGTAYKFLVRTGKGKAPEGTVNRRGGKCLLSGVSLTFDYIREEARLGRMEHRLMAVVADGPRGRVYLPPCEEHSRIAQVPLPKNIPDTMLPDKALGFRVQRYGMIRHSDLFTKRQLLALSTFSDLVPEVHRKILQDLKITGASLKNRSLEDGGISTQAYADAVATYLAFCADKCSDYWCTIATWSISGEFIRGCFARQAIPMTWDFAECNPLSSATGNWNSALEWIFKVVEQLPANADASVNQISATEIKTSSPLVFCTDPPYYDNIGYADLSDFFYVWLRRSLISIHPQLFSTILVPKSEELIASPFRFGGDKDAASNFFEQGLGKVFTRIRENQDSDFPCTVFYAFKQAEDEERDENDETDEASVASTGWETMLEGLLKAGLTIQGTLPMRSERGVRSVAIGTNALASSIVLVCRPRAESAPITTRREYLNSLKVEMPTALERLRDANIAATDLAQAAIGPGIAVFSRYSKVMEADGSAMTVRTALALINQVLDEVNTEGEGDFDPDSRWAVSWFETHGFEEGVYGEAETLSKAKNTSTSGLVEAGVITSKAGKVKLIPIEALPEDWNPKSDTRLTVWEVTHHLIRVLETKGEEGAATLMKEVGAIGEVARDLAYRLYSICERKKWAKDALRYNGLIVSWSGVSSLSQQIVKELPKQTALALGERGA